MAVTKVTDAMRNVTQVDAAKITTGTIPDARIQASGVTQHVVATDLTPVKNDISLLALQTAINGNMSAYGLKNSWIEQFENSTYIENLTNAARNSAEYISSISEVAGTPAYATGNRKSFVTLSFDGFTFAGGTPADMLDGVATSYGSSAWPTAMTPSAGAYLRFQFTDNNTTGSTKKLITENRWYQNVDNNGADWKWQGSNDASDWTTIGNSFTMGDGQINNTALVNTNMNTNTTPYTYYQMLYVSGANSSNPYWQEIEFKQADVTLTASATGSFNSTDVVPQDTTNKSSVGLVMLYKDNGSSSCVLNTDIVAQVRADTGQAYDSGSNTLALVGAGTYSDSLKIAIAPAIAVTAGQALSYKISFANQSSGTKDARIHGVAMTY